MTNKQFEGIGKQLLSELPGFVASKNLIVKSPIGDFLEGFCFDRCSDADSFHFHVFFMPLFVPKEYLTLSFGSRIGNALDWDIKNPNLLMDLRTAIRREAIPFLNRVSTAIGVIEYLRADNIDRRCMNPHTLEALAYILIRTGDNSSALRTLDEIKHTSSKSTDSWELELAERARLVQEKLSAKPELALAQLEAWKAETVNNLRLNKYFVLQTAS